MKWLKRRNVQKAPNKPKKNKKRGPRRRMSPQRQPLKPQQQTRQRRQLNSIGTRGHPRLQNGGDVCSVPRQCRGRCTRYRGTAVVEPLLRWRQSSVTGGKTVSHTRKGWRARSSHTGCTGRPQQGALVRPHGQHASVWYYGRAAKGGVGRRSPAERAPAGPVDGGGRLPGGAGSADAALLGGRPAHPCKTRPQHCLRCDIDSASERPPASTLSHRVRRRPARQSKPDHHPP
eukprot:COSAG01_NODE_20743_length_937_cov_2.721957_1_plen_231_part_00